VADDVMKMQEDRGRTKCNKEMFLLMVEYLQ
jgi:hypothetical protein